MLLCETDFNYIVFYPISFCWIIYIIKLYDWLISGSMIRLYGTI